MKRTLCISILLVLYAFPVVALSISTAELEVELHEQNGRFSVYAIQDNGDKTALLVSEDPRTTMLTVLAGSKIYRMGDSFEFRQAFESTSDSAEFTWTNATLAIKERFELDGPSLTISITVENTSEQDLDIGMRYLLDTYLGEKGEHFSADGLSVEKETDYAWVAPYEIESSDDSAVSLYVLLSGTDITDPDRVVIANWKRLNDTSWTFEANGNRDFSVLPYSINDSALALYFEPQTVTTSAVRTASFKLYWRKAGVVYTSTPDSGQTSVREIDDDLVDALLDEVAEIDSLLLQINRMISSNASLEESDIADLQGSLLALLERKKELSERQ